MAGQFWFGTRGYMQWVAAPAINMDATKKGWATQTNYLNGGAYVRKSLAAHKEYSLAWNLTTRERIRAISDYADGLFGQGPIYWADPFVMDTNMLPAYWASPFMGIYDGPILNEQATLRPTSTPTPANTLGYPAESAVYTIGAGTKPSVWIPIPPGYVAWVGFSGSAGTGGLLQATPTTGVSTLGTPVSLTPLSVTDPNRVNQSFDGNVYNGVQLSLAGTGTIVLSGIMVQLLPNGSVPFTGSFISGQGHSGCQFASQPLLTQYNAIMDRVGLSAVLVETNAWL